MREVATIETASLARNLFIREFDRFRRGLLVSFRLMNDQAEQRLTAFDVRPPDPHLSAGALSGGNLQKLVLARELSFGAPLLIAENPTAGLDPSAAKAVRQAIRAYANQGNAVVLFSFDLADLLRSADRVAVLSNMSLVGIGRSTNLTAEALGVMMGGVSTNVSPDGIATSTSSGSAVSMLSSSRWWERRVACQILLRNPNPVLLSKVEDAYQREQHPEVLIWLSMLLSRLDHPKAEESLTLHAQAKPDLFIDVARRYLVARDNPHFRDLLLNPSADDPLSIALAENVVLLTKDAQRGNTVVNQ